MYGSRVAGADGAQRGGEQEPRVPLDHVLPVPLVGRRGQGAQLAGDEVGEAHPGRGGGVGFGARPPRVVPVQDLHHQGVQAPALDDDVADGEHQPPAPVGLQAHGEPQQRRPLDVEQLGVLLADEPAHQGQPGPPRRPRAGRGCGPGRPPCGARSCIGTE